MKTKPLHSPYLKEAQLAATGARIKEARQARGLSQNRLATLTSIRPERLSRLEKGRSEPQMTELVRLSEALEVKLEQLVLGRDEIRNLVAQAGLNNQEADGVIRVLRGLYAFHLAMQPDGRGGKEAGCP